LHPSSSFAISSSRSNLFSRRHVSHSLLDCRSLRLLRWSRRNCCYYLTLNSISPYFLVIHCPSYLITAPLDWGLSLFRCRLMCV
jgi:hypothetical protein